LSRERYHHDNLKERLIQSGLAILDGEGYEGLTLRKVAKACGVSQTAPYRHFANKDELIAAITQQAMQAFSEQLAQAAAPYEGNPRAQLKHIGVAYVRFFTENPAYLRLLFFSDMPGKGDGCGPCEEDHMAEGHPFAIFFRAVERYAATQAQPLLTRDELLLYCWGLTHGLSALLIGNQLHGLGAQAMPMVERIIWHEAFLP
jgi:AcrR family transcriptional regulator